MIRLISIILLHQIIIAQVSWYVSGESGYYRTSGDFLKSQEEILTRLNLRGGYNYKNEKIKGNIKFQIRPEIYGFENKLQTTKIGVDGLYSQSGNKIDWTLHLAANQFLFSGDIADFSYDSFYSAGQFILPVKKQTRIDIKVGFAYRNFDLRNAVSLDILFAQLNFHYLLNPFINVSGGIYTEKFNLKKTFNLFLNSKKNQNKGTRIGPTLKFNYIRKLVFNLECQWLLHDSQITFYPSYDQWIRIIAGTNIKKNISAFILLDYYKKYFEYTKNEGLAELLYSPVNVENRFYLKLINAFSSDKKIFFKIGYYDEQLFYRNYSLSGWKGYIGFEIRG